MIEETKETVLDFSEGTVKVFWFYFLLWYNMTKYNTLNVKLSNSEYDELKSGMRNGTEVTLKPPSNVIGDSNDETNFPHKIY